MKYIRTKDKIYGSEKWENHPTPSGKNVYYDINCNAPVIKKDDIVKQADTIEELCDEFVIKVDNDYLHAKYYCIDRTFYVYNTDEEISLGECLRFNYIVFGAIWTDKGLIYVAKMNEEGVLELL